MPRLRERATSARRAGRPDSRRAAARPRRLRRPALIALACALVTMMALAAVALASPGDLDSSFGKNGIALTEAGSGDGAAGIVREGDGSFAVAGSGTSKGGEPVIEVAHYTSGGALDASFGSKGFAVLPEHKGDILFQPSIAYQPSTGDIIIAGTWESPLNVYVPGDFGIVALKPDGSLDTSFGTGGIVDSKVGEAGDALAVAVDPGSGAIYVGGDAFQAGGKDQLALAAYNATGALNTGFDGSGIVLTPVAGGNADISALALDGSKIVAAGALSTVAGASAIAMRYTSAGAADTTFNGGKPASIALGNGVYSDISSALVQSPHKIVLGGYAMYSGEGCMALARLNADGSLDVSFGSAGEAHLCASGAESGAEAIAAGPEGHHIYAAGYSFDIGTSLNRVLLARFSSEGALDTSFGSSGKVLSDADGAGNSSSASAIAMDGSNPVIAGQAHDETSGETYFALERFLGAGALTAPQSTVIPAIAGSTVVGQSLDGSPGDWTGSPTSYIYEWQRCPSKESTSGCQAIRKQGLPASTAHDAYTLQAADAGSYMRLEVKAVNAAGYNVDDSKAVGPVTVPATPPVNAARPSVSLSGPRPQPSAQFLGSPGSWSGTQPISYTYTWLRCASGGQPCQSTPAQSGASSRYTIQQADVGHRMLLEVTATNAGGSSTVAAPAFTGIVAALQPPANTSKPTVRGPTHPRVGDRLTIENGRWSGTTPMLYSYGWLRCKPGDPKIGDCKGVSTSSDGAYTAQPADYGHTLLAEVIAHNVAGSTVAYAGHFTWPVDNKAGTIHKEEKESAAVSRQIKKLPSISELLKGKGSKVPKPIIKLTEPGRLILGGVARVITTGGGNVIAAGGGNVISAGGGNVISAGGGNVISAGGGNVISAGGGNVISAGGGNVISAGGGNSLVDLRGQASLGWGVDPMALAASKRHRKSRAEQGRKSRARHGRGGSAKHGRKGRSRCRRSHSRRCGKTKLVALFRGSHRFARAGSGTIDLRLTKAGRRLLGAYEHRVRAARAHHHHHKVGPLRFGLVTVVAPLNGHGPAVSEVRMITIRR